jgi:hypothetical protein
MIPAPRSAPRQSNPPAQWRFDQRLMAPYIAAELQRSSLMIRRRSTLIELLRRRGGDDPA